MTIEEKLKHLAKLQSLKEAFAAKKAKIEEEIDDLNAVLCDEFESRQVKSIKLDGIGNFVMKISSYPKIFNPVEFRRWLDNNKIPFDVVAAVHAKKFRGFYNELLENGNSLPDGCGTYTKSKIALTRG